MVYWIYRTLALLPLSVLYRLADLAALFLGNVIRYRRSVVDDNLARSFPSLTGEQRDKIRRRFYQSLADVTVETIAGSRLAAEVFSQRVTIENPELLHAVTQGGHRSALVMTLHLGNWEWMLHRAAAEYEMDQAFIYKRLHSASADRFALEARQRFGAEAIEMRETSRNIVRNRRRPRLIFILGDQSPGLRERVQVSQFLNQPTAFFLGAATLARAAGYPLVFAVGHRLRRGHYSIRLELIAENPKAIPEDELMECYVRLAERHIRQSPEEWLWTNRRWKHQLPEAADASASGPTLKSSQSNPAD